MRRFETQIHLPGKYVIRKMLHSCIQKCNMGLNIFETEIWADVPTFWNIFSHFYYIHVDLRDRITVRCRKHKHEPACETKESNSKIKILFKTKCICEFCKWHWKVARCPLKTVSLLDLDFELVQCIKPQLLDKWYGHWLILRYSQEAKKAKKRSKGFPIFVCKSVILKKQNTKSPLNAEHFHLQN